MVNEESIDDKFVLSEVRDVRTNDGIILPNVKIYVCKVCNNPVLESLRQWHYHYSHGGTNPRFTHREPEPEPELKAYPIIETS